MTSSKFMFVKGHDFVGLTLTNLWHLADILKELNRIKVIWSILVKNGYDYSLTKFGLLATK